MDRRRNVNKVNPRGFTMEQDLKELAKLKIKADLYKELYDKKKKEIQATMKVGDTIKDPDGILVVELRPGGKRQFNIAGIREVFGAKADICIIETVEAAKFDMLSKNKGKYLITEDQQKKCFTIDNSASSFCWEGLETYQKMLEKAAKGK